MSIVLKPMHPGMPYSPSTMLLTAISESSTTIEVVDGRVLPDAPNEATIGTTESAETIHYGRKEGNILYDVIRGVQREGEARAWAAGNTVARNINELDFERLRDNITSIYEGLDSLEVDFTPVNTDIANLTADLTAAKQSITEHNIRITNNTGLINDVNSYITPFQTSINSLESWRSTAISDLQLHYTGILAAQGRLTTVEGKVTTLEGTVASARTDILQNAGNIGAANTNIAIQQSNISLFNERLFLQNPIIGQYAVSSGTRALAIGTGPSVARGPQSAGSASITIGSSNSTTGNGPRTTNSGGITIGSRIGTSGSAIQNEAYGAIIIGSVNNATTPPFVHATNGSASIIIGSYNSTGVASICNSFAGVIIGGSSGSSVLEGALIGNSSNAAIAIGGTSSTGYGPTALGHASVAIGGSGAGAGNSAQTSGHASVAIGGSGGIGDGATAIGNGSIAIGGSTAGGRGAFTSGQGSVAIGGATLGGLGAQIIDSSTGCVAIGGAVSGGGGAWISDAQGSIAIGGAASSGNGARAIEYSCVAIGGTAGGTAQGAFAGAWYATAIGAGTGSTQGAQAHGQGSIAIGTNTRVEHTGGTALGWAARTTANNQIMFGDSGATPTAYRALSVISDQRDKADIQELTYDPLLFINRVAPVQYRLDFRRDYEKYVEITEVEYNALDATSQKFNVITMQAELIGDIEYLDLRPPVTGVFSARKNSAIEDIYILKDKNLLDSKAKAVLQFKHTMEAQGISMATFIPSDENPDAQYAAIDPSIEFFEEDENSPIDSEDSGIELAPGDTEGTFDDAEISLEDLDLPIKPGRKIYFLRTAMERDGSKKNNRLHNGVLAQQVKEVADQMGFDFAGFKHHSHNGDNGEDIMSISYEEFIAPMIGAIQMLTAKVEALESELQK